MARVPERIAISDELLSEILKGSHPETIYFMGTMIQISIVPGLPKDSIAIIDGSGRAHLFKGISIESEHTLTGKEIVELIRQYRFHHSNEKQLQDGVEIILKEARVGFDREYRMSEKDRPDFWIPDIGMAIEIKIKGSRAQVYRQLNRYALQEQVKFILLITTKLQHVIDGPMEINNKPIYYTHISSL